MYLDNKMCTAVFDHTIKPVQSHCFTVEKAEATKFRSQNFHSYIAGSGAIAETKRQN